MFKVTFNHSERYWYNFKFKFESLEEAQKFAESALAHFFKEDDEDGDMIIDLHFDQTFSTSTKGKDSEATED